MVICGCLQRNDGSLQAKGPLNVMYRTLFFWCCFAAVEIFQNKCVNFVVVEVVPLTVVKSKREYKLHAFFGHLLNHESSTNVFFFLGIKAKIIVNSTVLG